MEDKKMQQGLENLNGFLNFVDAATIATGAGSLVGKGLRWGGKKLIKRGTKILPKERYVNLGANFNSDHDIDRELANVIDYFNQQKTTERLAQIDSELVSVQSLRNSVELFLFMMMAHRNGDMTRKMMMKPNKFPSIPGRLFLIKGCT